MNDLINTSVLTMSSLEIAKLVEKRHDNVKRTIESCVEKGVIHQPQIEDGPKSANQVTIKIYNLEKRDSFIVVAQLSPEFTARLVDRWQELEGNKKPMTTNEFVLWSAQRLVDQERELAAVSERTKDNTRRLDQIETANDQFTIVGWVNLTGSGNLPLTKSAAMGTQATKFCKDNGVDMGTVPDPRFGKVNTYPKWVLDDMFGENL